MEAITFKTLTTEAEINQYMERFKGYVQVKLPYDYAQRSRIVGVYKGSDLVGGYMLVTKPQFRSLMFLPDGLRNEHEFFSKDPYEMMEVNGLWIGAGVKTASEQFRVWLHMLKDVFMCKKKYVLLMSDHRNRNIRHIHRLMGSQEIYEGPPLTMVGSRTHERIRVGYTTRWALIRNIPQYWAEYRNRSKKATRRVTRQKTYSGKVVKAG